MLKKAMGVRSIGKNKYLFKWQNKCSEKWMLGGRSVILLPHLCFIFSAFQWLNRIFWVKFFSATADSSGLDRSAFPA